MVGELIAAVLLSGVALTLVARFVRAPDAVAREHDAGAHLWTFTTKWYSGPGALPTSHRHARIDVYERALVLTPMALRLIIPRKAIHELVREPEGWRSVVRGQATQLETSSHGSVILAIDEAAHERLRAWLDS